MYWVLASLVLASPSLAENILELDLSPEQAARFLQSKPFATPELTPLDHTRPLVRWDDARFRDADAGPTRGHYWRNGHEIQNTDDYVEEVYNAAQYHGQDGLGAYAYGYRAPESAKTEERARSGDVNGQYVFRDGDNRLIQVRYWADSSGFHQEDNVPRDLPQETPEVLAARAEHARAWQEAADAAAANPDTQQYDTHHHGQAQQYPGQQQQLGGQQQQYGGQQQQYGSQQQQYGDQQQYGGQRQPYGGQQYARQQYSQSAYSSSQVGAGGAELSGAASEQQVSRLAPPVALRQGKAQQEPEPTGPPRGFFYSYTYPVSIIVDKHPQRPLDHDTVGAHA